MGPPKPRLYREVSSGFNPVLQSRKYGDVPVSNLHPTGSFTHLEPVSSREVDSVKDVLHLTTPEIRFTERVVDLLRQDTKTSLWVHRVVSEVMFL